MRLGDQFVSRGLTMNSCCQGSLRHRVFIVAALANLVTLPLLAQAGGTPVSNLPADPLFMQQGGGAGTSVGDYISAPSPGLDTYYSYFIEVPPGVTAMRVEVFDADVGAGGGAEDNAGRDRARSGSFDTSTVYTLRRPDGTQQWSQTCSAGAANNFCRDNNWSSTLSGGGSLTINTPAAGHWELRIDSSNSGGDDINALGVRAFTSSGTDIELNVYADSFVPIGVNDVVAPTSSRTYRFYPYLTGGCTAESNNFDYDANAAGSQGSIVYTSRTGAFTQTTDDTTLSINNSWANTVLNTWTTDAAATDYGIWTVDPTIIEYAGPNSNYSVLYFTSDTAANPPPTTQPQAGAFRYYLPTDAGTTPVKPYAGQQVTYVSGPNPPQVGQVTRARVTVGVVNPGALAVTFSAANNVTANVPGGGAVYAGNPQVSQGSIVSQPGIGGTGNVVWDPTTLAAGATATLSYEVDVTPASAGQRIPVTGTPATNGTTAQYLDHTGNTTQTPARPTYRLGPLCGLAVTQGLLTYASIASVRAYSDNGQVTVEWRTAGEVGTAGFHLLRRNASGTFEQLNSRLLPGLLHASQGGVYRYADAGASKGGTYTYKLVEVELNGHRREYGPYTLTVDATAGTAAAGASTAGAPASSASGAAITGTNAVSNSARAAATVGRAPALSSSIVKPRALNFGQAPFKVSPAQQTQLSKSQAAQNSAEAARRARRGTPEVKAAVTERGLYYVSAEQLAPLFGDSVDAVRSLIPHGRLTLSNRGKTVAYLPAAGNAGLYFFGEAINSTYTDQNVYWLTRRDGSTMPVVPGTGPAAVGDQTFTDTVHVAQDAIAATAIPNHANGDFWYWKTLIADDPTYGSADFTVRADGAVTGDGRASLTVRLQGFSSTSAWPDHRVQVSLNDTLIGEATLDGQEALNLKLDFDAALLRDGDNKVTVRGVLGSGVAYSIFLVDGFDLSYTRRYRAVDNRLLASAAGHAVVTVDGFTDRDIEVFEVTNSSSPRRIAATTVDSAGGGYRVSFRPTSPKGMYYAAARSAIKTPASLVADAPSSLKEAGNAADYLVIAPAALRSAADGLAAYRGGQGLQALVVDLEDIYDEFNNGIASPEAIRTFLTHTRKGWARAPRYVVLAGGGTYDYKNKLGLGGNLIPPLLAATDSGLFAADNRFADVEGDDGVPEFALGRLPVVSADELQAYVSKLSRAEAGGDWRSRVALSADAASGDTDFGADSDVLAQSLPSGHTPDKIYLSTLPIDDARVLLRDTLNAGAGMVNYLGHGGMDRFSAAGLLTTGDVPTLTNADRLPVMSALTCIVNRFEIPGFAALGPTLITHASGGAATVWAPSGLSRHNDALLLGKNYFGALYLQGSGGRVGDAVVQALKAYRDQGGASRGMLDIYNLLGDPAARAPN